MNDKAAPADPGITQNKKPATERTVDDDELMSAVRGDIKDAKKKMDGTDTVSESDVEKEDAEFFAEFQEYFSDGDEIELIDDEEELQYRIKVESMTVKHIRQFKKQLNIAIRRFTTEELTFNEEGALNWQSAMPVIVDIVLDDLLELVAMSCQVIKDGNLTPLTIDELDMFQHEWLPMIIIPWIRRNFVDPKKRKPWMMAVRGFTRKFLGLSGGTLSSALATALQSSPQEDSTSQKSSTG